MWVFAGKLVRALATQPQSDSKPIETNSRLDRAKVVRQNRSPATGFGDAISQPFVYDKRPQSLRAACNAQCKEAVADFSTPAAAFSGGLDIRPLPPRFVQGAG
jgi:hypothetical protein